MRSVWANLVTAVLFVLVPPVAVPAWGAPVEIILTLDPFPPVVLSMGFPNAPELVEQYPGSLQANLSGHVRILVDPEAPATIQFLGANSRLELADGTLPALPGGLPANLALESGSSTAALRDVVFAPDSGTIPLTPSGIVNYLFPAAAVSFYPLAGRLDYDVDPFAPGASVLTPTPSLNQTGNIAGVFTYFPGDYMFLQVPLRVTEALPFLGNVTFAADLRFFALYSPANMAEVTEDDATVQVLGGPGTPGGVSASFTGIEEPGTFSAQVIGVDGLSYEALTQFEHIPDLVYSRELLGADLPVWELNFTESFTSATVTLGFDPGILPAGVTENDLVLYHFSESRRAWMEYTTPIWNVSQGTVEYTTPNWALINGVLEYTNPEMSPFVIGVQVPESSSLLLGGAAFALAGSIGVGRRRRRPRRVNEKRCVGGTPRKRRRSAAADR